MIGADDPSRLVVARMGAPLLLGLGEGENFAASDTSALLQVTRNIVYLEEGDCAEVTLQALRIVDARGHVVERPLHVSQLTADAVELGSYRHYMQKEIFEQPAAVSRHAGDCGRLERGRTARAARRRLGPDPRLRHQLPRGMVGALLDREHRRHAVHGRDRERVPLPRDRAEPATW